MYLSSSSTVISSATRPSWRSRCCTSGFETARLISWLTFSVMSFGDGYLFADPYPGYGQLEQRWKAAQDAYNAGKSALIEELTAELMVEKAIDDCSANDYCVVFVKRNQLK